MTPETGAGRGLLAGLPWANDRERDAWARMIIAVEIAAIRGVAGAGGGADHRALVEAAREVCDWSADPLHRADPVTQVRIDTLRAALDGEAAMTSTTMTQSDRAIGAEAVLDAIRREYARARDKHAPLRSGHEAVGVIGEEFTEFCEAVWWGVGRHGRPADPAHEAIQLAAMALAYIVEVYGTTEAKRQRRTR